MAGHNLQRIYLPPRKIVVITAPSGAGKTSLVKKLLRHMPFLSFSVSATTRPMREGEANGRDYYFMTVDEFKRKVGAGDFVEYEEVYAGQYYGTLKSELQRIWNNRQVAVFDIDVKGAANIKQQFGNDVLSIFIKPPSAESLAERLRNRHTENAESLKKRLAKANEELSYESRFDCTVVNKDFDTAYMRVKNHLLRFLQQTA